MASETMNPITKADISQKQRRCILEIHRGNVISSFADGLRCGRYPGFLMKKGAVDDLCKKGLLSTSNEPEPWLRKTTLTPLGAQIAATITTEDV